MPLSGGLLFSWTLPFVSAKSLNILPLKGEFVACVAVYNSVEIAWSDAAHTAGITEAVAIEPPESGPGGRDVSPRTTLIRSRGTPVLALTICARIVYVPVPMSWVAQATRTVPSLLSSTFASQGRRSAIHEHAAIPQPNMRSPSRIEPTAGFRFDQPSLSAPTLKHS